MSVAADWGWLGVGSLIYSPVNHMGALCTEKEPRSDLSWWGKLSSQ